MFFSAPKNKRMFPAVLLFLVGVFGMVTFGFSQTVLSDDNFESDFGNWNDGGDDVHRMNESSIINLSDIDTYECVDNLSGKVVRLRDNSDSNSSLISNKFDFSNFNSVAVSYNFFVASMENGNEDWFLELSSDNGNNWITIKQYVKEIDFNNNDCGSENYGVKEIVTFNANNYVFNTKNKLRLRCDASSNNDYVFIDNLTVTGYEDSDTNDWLGYSFDFVTEASRWSKSEVPNADSNIRIPSDKKIRIRDDREFNNVTISSDGNLTINLDGSLTVQNNIVNTGIFKCYSNDDEFGSLIVNGTVDGVLNYHRWVNNWEPNENGNDIISPPVSGQTWSSFLTENTLSNGTHRIYNNGTLYAFYNYNNGYYGWSDPYSTATDVTLDVSQGYRVSTAQNDSRTVKFTGNVETGNVSVNLRNVQTRWNVVGNPYPSYVSLSDFLTENIEVLDENYAAVYGYNGINGTDGWSYYNLTNAIINNVTIAPGQGFYLAAKSDNVTVTFTPDMRTVVGGDDFLQDGRSTSDVSFHKLRLSLENGSQIRHTELYFLENNNVSEGFDLGYDTNIFDSGDNYNLYSKLVTDSTDEKLAIQTLPLDNVSQSIVPIGVEAVTGQQITFSIDNIVIPDDVVIYLEDRDKDTWTLLNDMTSYIVDVNETISGTGRFFLHFEPNDALSNKDINLNEVGIKAIHNTKQIIISGQLAEDTNVSIYDINGRTILKTTIDAYNTTNRIDVKNLITGIYLVQLNNNSQTVSKQILIK
jgi:hypothetical protein